MLLISQINCKEIREVGLPGGERRPSALRIWLLPKHCTGARSVMAGERVYYRPLPFVPTSIHSLIASKTRLAWGFTLGRSQLITT